MLSSKTVLEKSIENIYEGSRQRNYLFRFSFLSIVSGLALL